MLVGEERASQSRGLAYLLDINNGNLIHELVPIDISPGDFFGHSLDISTSKTIVSSFGDDDNGSFQALHTSLIRIQATNY